MEEADDDSRTVTLKFAFNCTKKMDLKNVLQSIDGLLATILQEVAGALRIIH